MTTIIVYYFILTLFGTGFSPNVETTIVGPFKDLNMCNKIKKQIVYENSENGEHTSIKVSPCWESKLIIK